MQTFLSVVVLLGLIIIVYRQHLDIMRQYKINQEQHKLNQDQGVINSAFSAEICDLRSRRELVTPKIAALPPFIVQKGGNWYASN
jgi:cell division protein FtsL